MQPGWRGSKASLPMLRSAPDISWQPLCVGGSNGLFLVILALSWLPPFCAFDNPAATELVDDVLWAMEEMVKDAGANESIFMPASKAPSVPTSTGDDNMDLDADVEAEANAGQENSPEGPRLRRTGIDMLTDERVPSGSSRKRKAADDTAPQAKKQKPSTQRKQKPSTQRRRK